MYDNEIWNDEIINRTIKLEQETSRQELRYLKWYCPKCGGAVMQKKKLETKCQYCGNILKNY